MGDDETTKMRTEDDSKALARAILGEMAKWFFLASFFLVLILIDLMANQWNWF